MCVCSGLQQKPTSSRLSEASAQTAICTYGELQRRGPKLGSLFWMILTKLLKNLVIVLKIVVTINVFFAKNSRNLIQMPYDGPFFQRFFLNPNIVLRPLTTFSWDQMCSSFLELSAL
jgi:hypothetical protein